MKLRTLIFSCLTSVLVLETQSRADIVTFQFDTIPNAVTSFSIPDPATGLTISLLNAKEEFSTAVTTISNRDGNTAAANRGLTFDFNSAGFINMRSVDFSFDDDVMVLGYNVSISSNDWNNGSHTVAFGSLTGQSTGLGDHTFGTPIDLTSGTALSIAENSEFVSGYFIISSITVSVQSVPEPCGFLFLSIGGIALASRRKRN